MTTAMLMVVSCMLVPRCPAAAGCQLYVGARCPAAAFIHVRYGVKFMFGNSTLSLSFRCFFIRLTHVLVLLCVVSYVDRNSCRLYC